MGLSYKIIQNNSFLIQSLTQDPIFTESSIYRLQTKDNNDKSLNSIYPAPLPFPECTKYKNTIIMLYVLKKSIVESMILQN